MNEQTRLKARELLLRTRIYRFTALVFAVIGLLIFLYLYFKDISGDVLTALANPAIVAVILFPFLPAAVVSWMAARTRKKLMKTLETLAGEAAKNKGGTGKPPVSGDKKGKK